jgi:UDP-N-acetylglucosamine acyltransferase
MIHDSAIIRGNVELGERVTIEPYAVVTGPCTIEDDAWIGSHAIIGGSPQVRGLYPQPSSAPYTNGGVWVGAGATIREHSIIHHGVVSETRIGAGALIMLATHIGHDCSVGDHSTIGSLSALGGFVQIGVDSTFGQGVIVHPWIIIGGGSMIGMNAAVTQDVLPYQKVAGVPARLLGANYHKAPTMRTEWNGADVDLTTATHHAVMLKRREELRTEWASRA